MTSSQATVRSPHTYPKNERGSYILTVDHLRRFSTIWQWWHLYMNEIFSNKTIKISFSPSDYSLSLHLFLSPTIILSLHLPLFLSLSLSSSLPHFPNFTLSFLTIVLSLSHSIFSFSLLSLSVTLRVWILIQTYLKLNPETQHLTSY